jgi:hypothetical protein
VNARPEFLEIARCLVENGVEFILVGGVAAIVQGAPVSTFDLDIVIDPTDAANGERQSGFPLTRTSILIGICRWPAGQKVAVGTLTPTHKAPRMAGKVKVTP